MPVHSMTIDPLHTTLEFAVTYAMNTIVKGRFLTFQGTLVLDTNNPATSQVTVRIEAGSVETGSVRRDDHLRSSDFLDTENHDRITFDSTAVTVLDDGHWRVEGDLSIIGVTRPVTLDTHYYGIVKDATGTTRAGFVAETDIQRSDWGMVWNAEQETGVLVSDRVRISLFVSAVPDEDEAEHQPDDSEWAPPE